ncbi:MAG: mandelate racemase/muconate lactonizing enzyme family protein [Pirellulaceae bacterium]|jgi:L-alanine-DL-glutamate epimerase-like enolase superfamily enzyme|nr:mandelate racemase/muconate lactonizing enzyme family protein [Pirellulaceae bacterium]MDP7018631.1 mandelate racemase/muconate lactonizing enzyme family protein [Pirellulaceae bacterium]
MARIVDIERIWIDFPLKEVPFRNMVREIPHWSLFEICRVKLDTGHEGVGETMPYYTWGDVTDEAVERARGQNVAEVMWDDTLGAGLQMACFDAAGKLLDAPVWSLLGNKVREQCHTGWWAIDMPVEDWILECQEAVENGYTTFKTKARPWFDLHDQAERLTAATPDYLKIDLDFNDFGLDPTVAKPLCKSLEKYSQIAIWESPILQEDVEGNQQLRRHLSVPIAQHMGRPQLSTQIKEEICDGFVMEGGVTNATQKGAICAEFNKPFWLQWVGSNLIGFFGLHVQAVLSHALWPAIHCNHMYREQFVEEPYVVRNGMAEVPDRPGIGVTINWDVVEEYRVDRQEKPYPYPGLLLELQWPSGAKSYFTHAQQLWDEFKRGVLPAFTPGVHLVRIEDDGGDDWKQLYEQASHKPVHR